MWPMPVCLLKNSIAEVSMSFANIAQCSELEDIILIEMKSETFMHIKYATLQIKPPLN